MHASLSANILPLLEVGRREAPLDVCDTANAVTYYCTVLYMLA
jgi:hypothetical protein